MTTKEFIKMLQEEDPDGNCHIRIGEGVPYFAERKPGYWDGPYDYIDEQGVYHRTTKNDKIDIHYMTIDDIIWDNDGDMEILKKKFKPDFEDYSDPNQRQEIYNSFWDKIEKKAAEARKFHIESNKRIISGIRKDMKDGYTFIVKEGAAFGTLFKKKKGIFSKLEQCNVGEHETVYNNPNIFKIKNGVVTDIKYERKQKIKNLERR